MTPEEAIEYLQDDINGLKEQKYGNMGEIAAEVFREINGDERIKVLNAAIEALKEVQQYREIGTVEECVEARGKRMPILVKNRTIMMDFHGHPYLIRGDCPKCGSKALMSTLTDYCNACGQHLKWRDPEEKCESGKEDE